MTPPEHFETATALWHLIARVCPAVRDYLLSTGSATVSFKDKAALMQALGTSGLGRRLGEQVRQFAGPASTQDIDWDVFGAPYHFSGEDYDLLADFEEAYINGWLSRHREARRLEHLRDAENFIAYNKALNIIVGETLWFHHKGRPDTWFHGTVLFVHPSFNTVVLELPPEPGRDRPRQLFLNEEDTMLALFRHSTPGSLTQSVSSQPQTPVKVDQIPEHIDAEQDLLQSMISELNGRVADVHLPQIAERILRAEDIAESLKHALTQIRQLACRDSERFGPAREDIAARAAETLNSISLR